jgi:glutathione S-transferase
MPDLILHHYPLSTDAEKARLALGLKRLSYKEVITPPAMPKPDLVPLTGGYRRAPVLQIGADIICDTQLILRRLEAMHPEPTLFPDGCEGQATALAWWAERYIFMPALGFVANVNDELFKPDFIAERKKFGFIIGKDDVRPQFHRYVQQLVANMGWFVSMLGDGRPFMLGRQVSAADLGAYPAIWFLNLYGGDDAKRMLPLTKLDGWAERVAALGHGTPTALSGADALDIAKNATPESSRLPPNGDPSGLRDGTPVTVTPDDTGRDPVAGTLVAADDQEIVISRSDPRVGTVNVHFPRAGYDVVAA